MTQHVRAGYRRHRKATWGFALLSTLAVAAVIIPFASGGTSGRPATWTLTGDAAACRGTSSVAFDVVLTNTSKTQNLGSADLYAPRNITVTDASIAAGGGSSGYIIKPIGPAPSLLPNESTYRSLISLRSLTVPGGFAVTVHVTASVNNPVTFTSDSWKGIAKQANQFNPGDFDLSNAFQTPSSFPSFTVSTCELKFVTQPKNPWQKNTTLTSPVAVAVLAGTTRVAVSGTPNLSVTAGSVGATSDFSFGSATYNSSTLSWSWPDAKPNVDAPSGAYNLDANLGSMEATSDSDLTTSSTFDPFQVVDLACDPGQTCSDFSQPNGDQTAAGIQFKNTLATPVIVNFVPGGGPPACDPWHRASFTDPSSGETLYFPGVAVNMSRAGGDTSMLKVTYLVRNSEWVLTDVSRGNQDIDFCVGTKHQDSSKNGFPPTGVPFTTKYGDAARWGCEDPATTTCPDSDKQFWGVVPAVSNPNRVGSDPAVCARGTVDLNTGPGNTLETWRTWTHCIPNDWDYTPKGG